MSSAKHKLQSGRPPMDTVDSGMSVSSECSTASQVKQSSPRDAQCQNLLHYLFPGILNSTGDNGHPCHTPTVVRNKFPTLAFNNTALVALS